MRFHMSKTEARAHKILVPLMTPFRADETVDHEALAKLVRYELDCGADGIYAGGSSAECFLLTPEERKEALETVVNAANGAFVVANIGSVGTGNAENLARHAERTGADVISSVPPFYFSYTFDEILSYYRDLASSVSIPTMIYNFPGLTSRFSTDQFDTLLSDERIRYIKYTDTDYYTMEQIKSHSDIFVYSGKDENFLSALAAGADGGIGTSFNYMVGRFIEIQKLFLAQKSGEALVLQHRVNEVIRTVLSCGFFEASKYAISLVSGIDCGHCRRPFARVTAEQKKRIRLALEENGML